MCPRASALWVGILQICSHTLSHQRGCALELLRIVNRGIANKKRIVAVGTTSLRGLENSVSTTQTLKPFKGWTNKFIYPKFDFQIADALITNFHTPQSTLLMTTAAFAGHELTMEAYQEAIKEKYRFFAYGDALMVI